LPKISDNRIVCPVNAWRFLSMLKANKGCTKVQCCFHCSKDYCIGGAGCSPGHNMGFRSVSYPMECKSYPLTFGEAKRVFTFSRLFDRREVDPYLGYIRYAKAVEVFMSAKKEKESR